MDGARRGECDCKRIASRLVRAMALSGRPASRFRYRSNGFWHGPCCSHRETLDGEKVTQRRNNDKLAITLGVEEEFFLIDPETGDLLREPDEGISRGLPEKDRTAQVRSRVSAVTDRNEHLRLHFGRGIKVGHLRNTSDFGPDSRRARRVIAGNLHASVRFLGDAGGHSRSTIPRFRDRVSGILASVPRWRNAHSCRVRQHGFASAHHDRPPTLPAAAPCLSPALLRSTRVA